NRATDRGGRAGALMTLKGHDKIVSNLLFLDNDFLISSSYDRTIRLWDLHDKRCIRTFAGHDATLNSIAISSDKKYLYSADSSGKVLRWKVRNLGSEFTAPIMVSKVSASELVLSAGIEYENGITQMRQALDDGDYLSAIQHLKSARRQTGFHKGSEAIREWGNLYPFFAKKGFKAGWEQSSLTHRNAPINAIDISFYGSMAITGSQDQTAIVWNLATEEPLATFSDAQGAISDVSISKDASAALTASTDGKLRLYNVKSGKLIKTVAGHIGAINGAVLSYDARFFLSAGSDSFINLWSTEYNEPIRKFRGHNQAVLGVKLHPAGALAISFSADRTARVWNVATGDCLRTLAPGYGAVNSAAISLDQKQALLACETGMIVLYDLVKAEPIKNLEGHEGSVSSILFSFDQKFCLSTDVNRTVRLWDLESGTNLSVFEGHQSTVNDIALATDGRIAISAGDDGQAKTWILDWELNELKQSGWDDNAKIFLENFISYHTPYMAEFPQSRKPFDREIVLALSRSGTPEFSPSFQTELQYMLGAAGFGWIDNKTLVSEFDKIVSNWKGSIKSPISTDSSLYIDDDQIDEMETHHYRSEFINTEKKTLLSQWFRSSKK
ncbi:MAG: WD40 repeat domain-containing protein, partial [Nitrospinota bacterium]